MTAKALATFFATAKVLATFSAAAKVGVERNSFAFLYTLASKLLAVSNRPRIDSKGMRGGDQDGEGNAFTFEKLYAIIYFYIFARVF